MNFSKLSALLAKTLFVSMIVSNASANDGLYGGITVKEGTLKHSIERNLSTSPTVGPGIPVVNGITDIEESDFGYGVNLGYKHHLTDTFYLVGELFYNEEGIKSRNVNSVLVTDIDLKNSYGFSVKMGVDVTDKFSIYALGGMTRLDFDIRNSYTFADPVTHASRKESKFTMGIGMNYDIDDKWSVSAEYTQLKDVDFTPIPEIAVPGNINKNELDFSHIAMKLNYTF